MRPLQRRGVRGHVTAYARGRRGFSGSGFCQRVLAAAAAMPIHVHVGMAKAAMCMDMCV